MVSNILSWRVWLVLGGILLGVAGCVTPAPACQMEAIPYPQDRVLTGGSLQLGVIDASPRFLYELPSGLKQTQAPLAVLDDIRWGFIEPNPPENGVHTYRWNDPSARLDDRVAAYQDAGFQLVMVLRAWNPWARAFGPSGGMAGSLASTPPAAPYLNDYAAWVQALVERYDGDGIADSPSLRDVDGDGQVDPIRFFQIETETVSGTWWQGASPASWAEDYLTLLKTARHAAHQASEDAHILLGAIPATDLLDGSPAQADLQDAITHMDPAVCGALTAAVTILAATDSYDIVTAHSLADYTGLPLLAQWLATLIPPEKPVWLMGVTTGPALTADPQIIAAHPLYPAQGPSLWEALRDPSHPDHELVRTWYQGEQARLAFKKWVVAAASGFDVMVAGYEQDRPLYEHPEYQLRDLAFQGMLNPGESPLTRPVVHALATAQAHLSGYEAVRQLQGFGPGVWAFEFIVEKEPVYVFWYDDGIAQGPREATPTTSLRLRTDETQVLAFSIPTLPGQTSPSMQLYIPDQGEVTLTLGETPIIIRQRLHLPDSNHLYLPSYLAPHS